MSPVYRSRVAASVDGMEFKVVRDDVKPSKADRPEEMRGLTLCQPWASLMAFGEKRIETRAWKTDYTGLVAIHAASGLGGLEPMDGSARGATMADLAELCDWGEFHEALRWRLARGEDSLSGDDIARLLPRGVIVAVGRLRCCLTTGKPSQVGIRPVPRNAGAALLNSGLRSGMDLGLASELAMLTGEGKVEEAFGDFRPGRWAWVFDAVVPLREVLPCPAPRFKRGLWSVPWTLAYTLEKVWAEAATALDSRVRPGGEA